MQYKIIFHPSRICTVCTDCRHFSQCLSVASKALLRTRQRCMQFITSHDVKDNDSKTNAVRSTPKRHRQKPENIGLGGGPKNTVAKRGVCWWDVYLLSLVILSGSGKSLPANPAFFWTCKETWPLLPLKAFKLGHIDASQFSILVVWMVIAFSILFKIKFT